MNRVAAFTQYLVTKRSFSMMPIFNRGTKRQQRNNIALLENSNEYDYLKDEVARRLVDRLEDIEREFPLALDLGCGSGHLYKNLSVNHGLGGIKKLVQCDSAEKLLLRDNLETSTSLKTTRLVADEEFLPFPSRHFDLVLDTMKPDGAFIGAVMGGDSLQELRSAFILGDQERQGGISPHISPFMNVAIAGNLLSATGFNLCTVDTDFIQVDYPNAFVLMEHLRGMGENHAITLRGAPATRDSLLAAASIYQSMFGQSDGTVPATFQVIYLIGWSPHDSQQKPLRRGSAQHSFKELGHK